MVIRNISEAKAELSALVEQVLNGGEVIIAKAGKPVVRLVAYAGAKARRVPGSMRGEVWIEPGFDELPGDVSEAFGMEEPPK